MRILLLLFVFVFVSCERKPSLPDPVPTQWLGDAQAGVASYDFAAFEPFLSRGTDSVYVINFWATWCAPCIKELPHFRSASQKFEKDKVRVILVSLDMKKEVDGSLIPFIGKHGIADLAVHLHEPDADAWIPKVSSEWTGALPATLIYSKGKRKFYERSFTAAELDNEIQSFLN